MGFGYCMAWRVCIRWKVELYAWRRCEAVAVGSWELMKCWGNGRRKLQMEDVYKN